MANINIIAALGKDRAIGKHNQLLWHVRADLVRFKEITTGHPIVMGRKTFQSIGRVLPGRTNIVITRDPNWKFDGVTTISLDEALEKACALDEEVFVIGGGEIYAQALSRADRLY